MSKTKTYEEMLNQCLLDKQHQEKSPAYETELLNIEKLAKKIASNGKKLGNGQFGEVYKMDFTLSNEGLDTIPVAVKVLKLDENWDQNDETDDQNMFATELKINMELASLDPKNLFYPKFYGAYDVTDFFPTQITNETDYNHKLILKPRRKQVYTMFNEFLDLEMFQYIKIVQAGLYQNYLHTRLRILKNLSLGLINMVDKFTHCDLKPENIMFKRIDEEEMQRLSEENIKRLELFPGEYFQVKMIDFGLVAEGNRTTRACNGGTPGYIPEGFFTGDSSYNQDVFSLAMVGLDLELSALQMYLFSDIQDDYISMFRGSVKFDQNFVNRFKNTSIYKLGVHLWENKKYRTVLMFSIRKLIPNFDQDFSKIFDANKNMDDIHISKYYLRNRILFRKISLAILYTCLLYTSPSPRDLSTSRMPSSA